MRLYNILKLTIISLFLVLLASKHVLAFTIANSKQNIDIESIFKIEALNQYPQGKVKLYIDTKIKKIYLIINNKSYVQYPIAVGKIDTPTPIGNWIIKRKAKNWGTGFGTRWLELSVNWGLYGIHGTNKPWSIGRDASHGCIRLNNKHIEKIYECVKPAEEVKVYGNPFGSLKKPLRVLMRGEKGADVVELQRQLKRLGYYKGELDGIFGFDLEKSVKSLQRDMRVEVTAQIREKEYQRLGFGKISEVRERKKKNTVN